MGYVVWPWGYVASGKKKRERDTCRGEEGPDGHRRFERSPKTVGNYRFERKSKTVGNYWVRGWPRRKKSKNPSNGNKKAWTMLR